MINIYRNFFRNIQKLDKLLKQNIVGGLNLFILLMIGILLATHLSIRISNHFGLLHLSKLVAFICYLYVFIAITYGICSVGYRKKYILWGEKRFYKDIFREFSIISYVQSILFFLWMLTVLIAGISVTFTSTFSVSTLIDFIENHFNNIMYFGTIIASISWFSYHIVFSNVSLLRIKSKVSLYIAFMSTFSLLSNAINWTSLQAPITSILVSYFWIQYLLDERSLELDTVSSSSQH